MEFLVTRDSGRHAPGTSQVGLEGMKTGPFAAVWSRWQVGDLPHTP